MATLLAMMVSVSMMADTGEHSISREDQELFVRIISAEADPRWDMEGYMLLAQAVKNQIGVEGQTYHEVLVKPGNYTVYENGRYLSVAVSDKAKIAVNDVLRGSAEYDYGQRYFCTDWHYPVSWHKTRPEVARYKGVVFVR